MHSSQHELAKRRLAQNSLAALKAAGLAPAELAERTGATLEQIEAILSGNGGAITLDVLGRLATCLGVTAASLVE